MKHFNTFFLLILILSSCSSSKNQKIEEFTITYQAVSRGFYLNIEVEGNRINVKNEHDVVGTEMIINKDEVKALSDLFEKITLPALENYKGSTEKRFYDGAAIANLTVDYQGKIYKTADFDHGNPPAEIAEFINKIVSFTEIKK